MQCESHTTQTRLPHNTHEFTQFMLGLVNRQLKQWSHFFKLSVVILKPNWKLISLLKAFCQTHQLHLFLLRLLPTEKKQTILSLKIQVAHLKLSRVNPPFSPGRVFKLTYSNSQTEAWTERCLGLLAIKLEIQIQSEIQMKSQICWH